MDFSEFAKTLKPIIGGSNNTIEFTRNLFVIMLGEEKSDIIENYSDDSYKAYYNGRNSINNIAKLVAPHVEPANFTKYLDSFGDAVSQKLCNSFSKHIDGLDIFNVNDKLAEYFDDIIQIASSNQRRKSSNKDEAIEIPSEQPTSNFPYKKEDKNLLAEFNSDYDQIILNLIGEKYTLYLIDMSIPTKVKELYETKWEEKSNDFKDPTLKSHIFGLLGTLNELSMSFMSSNSNTVQIKTQRIKIRNLYVKLHPETYIKTFPYDVFIDDWNDGEI